jgi:hypothetical protein
LRNYVILAILGGLAMLKKALWLGAAGRQKLCGLLSSIDIGRSRRHNYGMSEILTSRDFQRASEQRFTTAEFLLEQRDYSLDAFYLAGYSVECILKALVMHLTPEPNREKAFGRLRSGARMHYPEHLNEELKNLGHPIPKDLAKGFRRFDWTTALRYEHGHWPVGEVRGYLKVAKKAIDWVKGEMK